MVLQRAAQAPVVVIGHAGGTHLRRQVGHIGIEPVAQALAVDQQIILLARQGGLCIAGDKVAVGQPLEDAREQPFLELARQRRPVAARHLQAPVDHGLLAIGIHTQARIALFAAHVRAPDGGHEELLVVRVELDLEKALQVLFLAQALRPPGIDIADQRCGDRMGLLVAVGAPQPDEDRIRIPVDNLVATLLHQRLGALDHLMAAQGDRRDQRRVEEAAFGRTQHPGKGVHHQLERLRQRLVSAALGLIACAPERGDDLGQAVLVAREACVHRPVDQ